MQCGRNVGRKEGGPAGGRWALPGQLAVDLGKYCTWTCVCACVCV